MADEALRLTVEARWFALPWPNASDANRRRDVLAELMTAYGEPSRFYHSLAHVANLLALSAAYKDRLVRPNLVDFAIFFHDAVYDATRRDNEAASGRSRATG